MNNIEINDEVLGELVAGSLNDDDYRKVILALDENPAQWRACALAFLEDQAIARELRAMAMEDDWLFGNQQVEAPEHQRSADQSSGHQISEDDLQTSYDVEEPASQGPVVIPAVKSRGNQQRFLMRFASLAALLLVSFSIGWMGSVLKSGSLAGGNQTQVSQGGATSTQAGMIAGGQTGLSSNQQLVKDDSGLANRSTAENPFSNVELEGNSNSFGSDGSVHFVSSGGMVPLDREMPKALRELERQGRVRVETFDALVSVSLEDGTSALVPIQQYRVVPTTFSY